MAEQTYEEMCTHYDHMYKHNAYGGHPMDLGRAVELWAWITAQLNPGSSVIDCSCGRGLLLQMLATVGYTVEGTEASAWPLENVLKTPKFPARKLFYSELNTLPDAGWDVVVSNSVLEHLFTEDEVRAALMELARAAKRWLLVAVSLNHATRVMAGRLVTLHQLIRPDTWWVDEVAKAATVKKHYRYHDYQLIFAAVSGQRPTPPSAL